MHVSWYAIFCLIASYFDWKVHAYALKDIFNMKKIDFYFWIAIDCMII